jgi:hypothetical protein
MFSAGAKGLMATLSMAAVTGALWHTKSVPTRNLDSLLPLQFSLPYFTKSQIANLQLLIRSCTFWKYFSSHDGAAVLTYWQFLFTYTFSSCSHETYLSVSPSCNKFNSGGLEDLWGFIHSLTTSSSAVTEMFACVGHNDVLHEIAIHSFFLC